MIQCPPAGHLPFEPRQSIRERPLSKKKRDLELGMKRPIARRDFLNGFGLAVGASLALPHAIWADAFGLPGPPSDPQKKETYYPPAKTGLRGSHDGSWEVAHALRDGKKWGIAAPDAESYDLIIVGAGISGLSAAYFYRQEAGPKARILILDNHDDFGGHAKRNEFRSGGRLLLGYGGTQSIAGPDLYSTESNPGSLTLSMTRNSLLPGDSRAAFSLTKKRLAEIFLCPVWANLPGPNSLAERRFQRMRREISRASIRKKSTISRRKTRPRRKTILHAPATEIFC